MPDWPAAVAEVRRVLKPGARFFFEEVASPLLRWTLRFTVEGWPPRSRPFSRDAFLAELEAQGLSVGPRLANRGLLLLATALSSGLVGDLVGVAERTGDLRLRGAADDVSVVCALPSSVARRRFGSGLRRVQARLLCDRACWAPLSEFLLTRRHR